jgi:hypothetical protein
MIEKHHRNPQQNLTEKIQNNLNIDDILIAHEYNLSYLFGINIDSINDKNHNCNEGMQIIM